MEITKTAKRGLKMPELWGKRQKELTFTTPIEILRLGNKFEYPLIEHIVFISKKTEISR